MIKNIIITPDEMRRVRRDARDVGESVEQYILLALKIRRMLNLPAYWVSYVDREVREGYPISFFYGDDGKLCSEVEDRENYDWTEIETRRLYEDKADAERALQKYLQRAEE